MLYILANAIVKMIFLFFAIFLFTPNSIESMSNNEEKSNKWDDFNNINNLISIMDTNIRNLQEKVQVCDTVQSQVSSLHSQLSILDRKLGIISKSQAKMNDLETKLNLIPTMFDEMSTKIINELKHSFNDKFGDKNQGEVLENVLSKINQIESNVEDLKYSCDKSDIKNVLNENFKSQNLNIENLMENCTKSKEADKTAIVLIENTRDELKSKLNDLDYKLNRVPVHLDEIFIKINVLEKSTDQINNKLKEKHQDELLENVLSKINNVENNTKNLKKSFEKTDIKNVFRENFKSQNENIEKLIKECNKPDETNTNITINEESLILSNSFDYTFCTSLKNQSGIFKFHTNLINLKEETRDYGVRSCEQGWMVIQNRNSFEYQENFNKSWYQYKHGFGDLRREFWFGNDYLHRLSNQNDLILRIELESYDNEKKWAEYESFKVASEYENYRLTLGRFSGTLSNDLLYNNNMKFSTYDKKDDNYKHSCAVTYGSGWWFDSCFNSNLNGFHYKKSTNDGKGIVWYSWLKNYSLKAAKMMIRPTQHLKQFQDLSFKPYNVL
ncbi:angiopoietin-related protein 7-like isoform X1 [Onthophagus taurus]|uniref:angiopoietin-related protein 7-like isoform X1 n=2 Tax=Onthophagus taurus TaxID=166361 RepID=UPI0039BE6080